MPLPKGTLRERNARVIRLKDELIRMLDLVVKCRESIEAEVSGGLAAKLSFVDVDFLKRFKEMAVIFNNLTDARIRLDKAEKLLENDLTPAEEQGAVIEYIKSLPVAECGQMLRDLVVWHRGRVTNVPVKRSNALIAILDEVEEPSGPGPA